MNVIAVLIITHTTASWQRSPPSRMGVGHFPHGLLHASFSFARVFLNCATLTNHRAVRASRCGLHWGNFSLSWRLTGEFQNIFDNGKILTETDNRHKVRYNPVSRNPALKYSGGALHGHGEDPLSFDHNFDRSQPCFFSWISPWRHFDICFSVRPDSADHFMEFNLARLKALRLLPGESEPPISRVLEGLTS